MPQATKDGTPGHTQTGPEVVAIVLLSFPRLPSRGGPNSYPSSGLQSDHIPFKSTKKIAETCTSVCCMAPSSPLSPLPTAQVGRVSCGGNNAVCGDGCGGAKAS